MCIYIYICVCNHIWTGESNNTVFTSIFLIVSLLPEFSHDVPYGHIFNTARSCAMSLATSLVEWAGVS